MYIEKKKIAGKEYYYLRQSIRENGKVKTKTIAYLGTKKPSKEELKKAIEKAGKPVKEFDINPGDIVEITTKEAEKIEGTIIPSFDEKILFIKLRSGYNTGIEKQNIKNIKKTGRAEEIKFPEIDKKQNENKPGISLIATGGTISSRLDYNTGGVKWLMKPEQLFFLAPKMFDIVRINQIERPFMMASENMSAKHWIELAKASANLLNRNENKGIIITHGTDTLHYTAAALSFMLKNINKPVILTYSQRSTDRGSTDTALNLTCSAYAALSDMAEVMLVGHSGIDDESCYMLRGTKVRKMHTSRRDAFRPINDVPIAKVDENGKIEMINDNFRKKDEKNKGKVIADTKFEEKIALVKFFPGADSDILGHYIEENYRGIVIEATGLGHVATDESEKSWLPAIKRAIEKNIVVCFAAQTLYGGLYPYVYTPGRKLLDAGVIFLEDMLPETAYVKLGWVLGHTAKYEKAKEMMLENIAGEFNKRIKEETFLY